MDVTIPGEACGLGHRHPMNKALDEAKGSSSAWAIRS